MKCAKCGGRFYARDEDGDLRCVTCSRPAVTRAHEQPEKEVTLPAIKRDQ